jgi:hypothetical protein
MIKLALLIFFSGLVTFNLISEGLSSSSLHIKNDSFIQLQEISIDSNEIVLPDVIQKLNNEYFDAESCQSIISKPVTEHKNWTEDTSSLANVQVVSCSELVEVYKLEKEAGYNMLAVTNSGRMQANIILRLVKAASEQTPNGPPLFIDYRDNFFAYLEAMKITNDSVPLFIQRSFDYHQDQLIEYRKNKVIRKVIEGKEPILAITGKAWWPKSDTLPDEFSYEDTLSDPNLMVINDRILNYRILEFEDQIVLDQIEGMAGYPTSGLLGVLFAPLHLFGNPSLLQVRMAVSDDSLLILYAKSQYIIILPVTSTVYPDGLAINELPENRPDLEEIEQQLEKPLEIEYFPYEEIDE